MQKCSIGNYFKWSQIYSSSLNQFLTNKTAFHLRRFSLLERGNTKEYNLGILIFIIPFWPELSKEHLGVIEEYVWRIWTEN